MLSDFGRYIASIGERDIDLLLMEELHIDNGFVAWFCSRIGIHGAEAKGAWHSVSDIDGETDLLLRVLSGNRRIGILIENKIAAPEQDLQAERYHLRGVRSREEGKFDDYVTVICAPQRYLDGMPIDSVYQHKCSYEDVADWYRSSSDPRSAWRCAIMREAIEQGRRGYAMVVNPVHTKFHFDYWEYLTQKYPLLKMARPKNKGDYSTWIIMKGHDFPKGVSIHHKLDQQVVELGFERRKVQEILNLKNVFAEDIRIIQKGGTASLVATVPAIDIKAGVLAQIGAIDSALSTACRLLPYANLFSNR